MFPSSIDYQLMACNFYMEFLLFLQNFDVISMQVKLVSVNKTTSESLMATYFTLIFNSFFLAKSHSHRDSVANECNSIEDY